jgi:F-type H+-transporting ATPase subunit b
MNYEAIATWSQVISSFAFLGVLVYLWTKFIQPAVLTAQENANRRIAEAERHRDEAKAALETLGNEIAGAKRDAGAIVARADEQARHEHTRTLEETREAGQRALRNAQGELERARAAARERLRTDLLDRALAIAHGEAQRCVDDNVNGQLVHRFITALERGPSTSLRAVYPERSRRAQDDKN